MCLSVCSAHTGQCEPCCHHVLSADIAMESTAGAGGPGSFLPFSDSSEGLCSCVTLATQQLTMWWTWQMVFAFAIASVIQLSHTLRTERSRAECGGGICRPAAQRQAMQYCRMLRSNVTQRCIMPSRMQSCHLGTVRQRLPCASQVRSQNNDHMQLLY